MRRTKKFHASRTHGRGKKAGRGAGMRGGRGNAGLHKHKYITTVKNDPKHFGRYGFTRPKIPSQTAPRITNVGRLEDSLDRFLKEGFARKKGKVTELDLTSAGIDKLLGSGVINSPLVITVDYATEKAKNKIETVGGKVLLPDAKLQETVSEAE